jgi:hypothetical protein
MSGRMARLTLGVVSAATVGRPIVVAACLLAAAGPARAQDDRPSDETLRALQERGRMIALYLDAVDRGAERWKKQGNEAMMPDRTVVIPDREGWRVLFLKDLTKDPAPAGPKKGMILLAETSFSPDAREVGDLRVMVPPHAAPAIAQSYARSLGEAETATVSRPDAGRPFEDAVVREKDATFTVYLISHHEEEGAEPPKGGQPGSLRFGRDFIIRVAASGRQVLSVEPLHAGASAVPLAPRPAGQPTLHTHEKGDLPTPTDVALVLRHRSLAPHLVLTPRSMFRIDAEGAVTWLGPNPVPAERPLPAPGRAPGGGAP